MRPPEVRRYVGATAEEAQMRFQQDLPAWVAAGWEPFARDWHGTALIVTYLMRGTPPPSPSPGPPPPSTAAQPQQRTWAATAIVIGGAIVVLSAFLPWVSASALFASISKVGVEGDGVFTAAAGVVVILAGLAGISTSWAWVVALVAALAAGGIGVMDLQDVQARIAGLESEAFVAQVGLGLWGTVAGALVATVAALYQGFVVGSGED